MEKLLKSLFLAAFLIFPVAAREWTSTDGRKMEADFISLIDGKVTLKREGSRKSITFPLGKLSEKDKEWAKAQNDQKKSKSDKPSEDATRLLTGEWEFDQYKKVPYAIYGKGIDPDKQYPLVIGLHGKSSNSTNGSQLHIVKPFIGEAHYKKYPAIVLAPLCYQPYGDTGGGWGLEPAKDVIALIKKTIKELPVDPKRVYILGMSMGGGGTATYIGMEPKLFAGGIIICGWVDGNTRAFKKVPVWAFHGSEDKNVPPDSIQELAKSLKRSKIFKYTEYEGAGHSIMGRVLQNEEIYPWLFSQKRK